MTSAGSRFTKAVLDQHVIRDFVGYTPSFDLSKVYTTAAGSSIKVTKVGTDYLVNGVKIVKPDVITMNGVVHYVENVSFSLFFA